MARSHSDAAARREAVSLAHRLHGTAGTYGLCAVSAASAILERALQASPPSQAEILDTLRALRQAVA